MSVFDKYEADMQKGGSESALNQTIYGVAYQKGMDRSMHN